MIISRDQEETKLNNAIKHEQWRSYTFTCQKINIPFNKNDVKLPKANKVLTKILLLEPVK